MATKYFCAPAGAGTYNWVGGGYWYLDLAHTIPTIDPTNADDTLFDSGFPSAAQIANVNATAYCKDMDWTGAGNTPTLAIASANINIYGSMTTIAAMVVTQAINYNFLLAATSGSHNITTNGLDIRKIHFNGIGGTWVLIDDLTALAPVTGAITFTAGTLNLNGKTVTHTGSFTFPSTGTKVLTPGSSVINGAGWNYSGSNLTLTANTATINCSGNFTGGAITTYNIINLTGATSIVSGDFTCAQLNLASGTTQTITFTAGQVITVTTSSSLSGSAGHVHTLTSTGEWSIIKTGGGTILADYVTVRYCQARPANTWYARPPSTDNGGNTGVVFPNTKGNPLSNLVNAGII